MLITVVRKHDWYNMAIIVGETRSDVKVLDRKVDRNQQESCEHFERLALADQ